ncbi:hypothetical protein JCM11251_006937 [Rhodosporidiobolus azoricus]
MPPPMPPKTSLSKGTLGLKFMNRQVPASPASSGASTPARGTPAPASSKAGEQKGEKGAGMPTAAPAAGRMSFGAPQAAGAQKEEGEKDEDWGSRRVAGKGSRPTVIHESSLLSFPLLSSHFSSFSTSTSSSSSSSSFTGTSSYSSMPLTSSTISGRRSFGGANVEIEKLNDPSSHQEEPKDGPGETQNQRKKRLKAERDAAPVSVRRSGGSTLSSAKTGKKTAALDKRRGEERAVESGSAKKRRLEREEGAMDTMRWEAEDDDVASSMAKKGKKPAAAVASDVPQRTAPLKKGEFARPGGFEGAKKGGAKGKGKGVMGDYQWGKTGDVREWDEDKEVGDSSSDDSVDDEAFMRALDEDAEEGELDDGEEDESSDESGSEVEEMLVKGKKAVGGKGKQARGKAVDREEARFATGGGGQGGKGKGNKVRR